METEKTCGTCCFYMNDMRCDVSEESVDEKTEACLYYESHDNPDPSWGQIKKEV